MAGHVVVVVVAISGVLMVALDVVVGCCAENSCCWIRCSWLSCCCRDIGCCGWGGGNNCCSCVVVVVFVVVVGDRYSGTVGDGASGAGTVGVSGSYCCRGGTPLLHFLRFCASLTTSSKDSPGGTSMNILPGRPNSYCTRTASLISRGPFKRRMWPSQR